MTTAPPVVAGDVSVTVAVDIPPGAIVLGLKANEFNPAVTVNAAVELPTPPAALTDTRPVVELAGTLTVICVAETMVNFVVATPLNLTAVAVEKFVPVIVTNVPIGPDVGVNDLTVGASGMTVNVSAEVAVPPGVLMDTKPVVELAGTATLICVAETIVNVVVATPLNLTAVAPVKFVPVIVTLVPTFPDAGLNDTIVGAVEAVIV